MALVFQYGSNCSLGKVFEHAFVSGLLLTVDDTIGHMDRLIRPSREEFDRLSLQVTEQMRAHSFPYVASISAEIEPNVGKHLGSGLYLTLGTETYLLTN
jgi:hypothetical protein